MGILSNVKNDETIQSQGDSLGGGFMVDSGVYPCEIEMAYVDVADSGAISLNVHLKTDSGALLRNQLWIQSGKAKGGNNYYVDKKGNKQYLPGYNQAEALALLTVGKHVNELVDEEKVIKLYNFDAKAELPTKVSVLTELLGQQVTVGVIKQVVDKNVKTDDGNGHITYAPSGETREENEIDKFFRAKDNMTVTEIRAEAETAEFIDAWEKKWKGQVKNKAKGAAATGATPGAPAAGGSGATAAPQKSLFT